MRQSTSHSLVYSTSKYNKTTTTCPSHSVQCTRHCIGSQLHHRYGPSSLTLCCACASSVQYNNVCLQLHVCFGRHTWVWAECTAHKHFSCLLCLAHCIFCWCVAGRPHIYTNAQHNMQQNREKRRMVYTNCDCDRVTANKTHHRKNINKIIHNCIVIVCAYSRADDREITKNLIHNSKRKTENASDENNMLVDIDTLRWVLSIGCVTFMDCPHCRTLCVLI